MLGTISIVIPVYNAERFLPKCITSIQNQTYDNFECIFVNDGSSDNSAQVILDIAKKDSRFKLLNQENSGVSSARNNGVRHSIGQYITFIDADDWIDEDYLKVLYDRIQIDNCDIASCGAVFEYGTHTKIITFYENSVWDIKKSLISLLCDKEIRPVVWGKLYRKKLLEENAIYMDSNIHYSEDTLYVLEVLLHSKKVATVANPMYHYRMDNIDSAQNAGKRAVQYVKKWDTRWNAYQKMEKILKESSYWNDLQIRQTFEHAMCELSRDMLYLQYSYSESNEITTLMKEYLKKHWVGYCIRDKRIKKILTMVTFVISPKLYKFMRKFMGV